jgi:hypothetical protein
VLCGYSKCSLYLLVFGGLQGSEHALYWTFWGTLLPKCQCSAAVDYPVVAQLGVVRTQSSCLPFYTYKIHSEDYVGGSCVFDQINQAHSCNNTAQYCIMPVTLCQLTLIFILTRNSVNCMGVLSQTCWHSSTYSK